MKRIFSLILAVWMLFMLVACDSDTPSEKESEKNKIEFEELVVIDNDECTLKITDISPNHMAGFVLKAQMENKSADKTYMFVVDEAFVCGVESDPYFAFEVEPGKKANSNIAFDADELEENGIEELTDIELTFRVYDSEDWSADDVAVETVRIYPYGEDKAEKFVREAQDSDTVLIDNEYVTMVVTGYERDEFWGYMVKVFIENKSDKNIMVSVDDASVNDYMAEPYFAKSLSGGKCVFTAICWDEETLEENGVTDVEKIEFALRVYDYDDWFADDLANTSVTLNP